MKPDPVDVIARALRTSERTFAMLGEGMNASSPAWASVRANVIIAALEEAGYDIGAPYTDDTGDGRNITNERRYPG